MTRHIPDLDFDWDVATTVNGYFVSQQISKQENLRLKYGCA